MTSDAHLAELRLASFKTFHDQTLHLSPLTVLMGRNSSGKSNALDGLEVLARLANGEEIVDALDGRRRDAGPVRGGLDGCPPHGTDVFTLGVEVRLPAGDAASLDVSIRVRPEVAVVWERLRGPTETGRSTTLLESRPYREDSADIAATAYNGKRGRSPSVSFRSSRLLTAQVPARLPHTTAAQRWVAMIADDVLAVLQGVFPLDPVPHLMRQYVPERDFELRRTGENLSATIGRLIQQDREGFDALVSAIQQLIDHPVRGLGVTRSDLGDTMLVLDEGEHGRTPAREMSDGMLRFLAIATALRTGEHGVDVDLRAAVDVSPSLTLVVEELENGLHPSQAAMMVALLKGAVAQRGTQVITTTHSPALLSSLDGADHEGVVACYRDRATGHSRLTRLPDVPGYPTAMAAGRLGDAVTRGELVVDRSHDETPDYTDFDRLIEIG